MRKRYEWLLAALLVVAVVAGYSSVLHAQAFYHSQNVTVDSKPIDSSVYGVGRNVTVNTDINGDVFCAGQNVVISGVVNGDVLCAAQTIQITGTVYGNVRLAGQNVSIGGHISGNASIVAQSFTLENQASIGKDLSLTVSNGTISGPVKRDLTFVGATLAIASHINRNVTGVVQDLTLQDGAVVGGDLTYTSNHAVTQSGNSHIVGSVVRHALPQSTHRFHLGALRAVGSLIMFVAFLVLALVVTALAPELLRRSADNVSRKTWPTLGSGAITVLLVPLAIVMLLISGLGLLLGILLGMAWIAVLMLSGPIFAYFIGRLILVSWLKLQVNIFLTVLLGVVLLALLSHIPIIGFLSWLGTWLFGGGSLALLLVQRYRRPTYTTNDQR